MFLFNLPNKFAYLTGCLILALFWLVIFLMRKDLRKEMVFASLLGLPMGITDYFLVPVYWQPQSLFGLMEKYRVGLESFLFFFLMAGLSSVFYEFFRGRKIRKIARDKGLHLLPIIAAVGFFLFLASVFPEKTVYWFILTGVFGASFIIAFRSDLLKQALFGAFAFALFYLLVFAYVIFIFPRLVADFYNVPNLLGVFAMGVPLEEILAAFFAGAFWSIMYEFVKGYRV